MASLSPAARRVVRRVKAGRMAAFDALPVEQRRLAWLEILPWAEAELRTMDAGIGGMQRARDVMATQLDAVRRSLQEGV